MMDPALAHERNLHSETDEVICDLEGLVNALDFALDAHPTLIEAHPASSAIFSLHRLIKRALGDLETARRKEWVGLGGSSYGLTEDEAADAVGGVFLSRTAAVASAKQAAGLDGGVA